MVLEKKAETKALSAVLKKTSSVSILSSVLAIVASFCFLYFFVRLLFFSVS